MLNEIYFSTMMRDAVAGVVGTENAEHGLDVAAHDAAIVMFYRNFLFWELQNFPLTWVMPIRIVELILVAVLS